MNLEEISGCKNLEYIEKYAFQNDVSLKALPEMPKLDWIAMGAFEGCVSLLRYQAARQHDVYRFYGVRLV